MAKVALTFRRALLAVLLIAAGAFALSVSLQVPATTRVTVRFAPRVPGALSPNDLMVVSTPRDPLRIVPTGGVISSLSRRPLFHQSIRYLRADAAVADGFVAAVTDSWLSAGAQRVSEISLDAPWVNDSVALRLIFPVSALDRSDWGVGVTGCAEGAQRLRPRRSATRAPGETLKLEAALRVCRGRETTVTIDTSPLVVLAPASAWQLAVAEAREVADSRPDQPVTLDASKMTPAGLDLPYTVEDELDGTPYPRPAELRIGARVVDSASIVDAAMECRRWDRRLAKTCWRELLALPAGACARAWSVRVDDKASVVHIDHRGDAAAPCDLLAGVTAPEGDQMHAFVMDLPRAAGAAGD